MLAGSQSGARINELIARLGSRVSVDHRLGAAVDRNADDAHEIAFLRKELDLRPVEIDLIIVVRRLGESNVALISRSVRIRPPRSDEFKLVIARAGRVVIDRSRS